MSGWPWRRPQPKPPPVEPRRAIAIWVKAVGGAPVDGASVRLDGHPEVLLTNADGYACFLAVRAYLVATHLFVTCPQYHDADKHLTLHPGNGDYDAPPLVPVLVVPAPLPRLRVSGHVFALETGAPFTAIQCSDFNLLNRWQHGEDIRPILEQRVGCGFNMLRVWTLYHLSPGIGTFLDIDYARIPVFLDLCASYGLYVECTAYTSIERTDHWGRLVAACQGSTTCLLELGNELDLPVNQINMAQYGRPSGVLASHGSASSQTVPPWEPWDYLGWHTNGASEEQRKIGHNAMEKPEAVIGWRGPVLTNETSRFPEVGMWVGADPARRRALAFDSAAGAALLCTGSCFHSICGKTSVLFDAATVDAALAWTQGARFVPLAVQHEPYTRRDDLLTPDLLRVYQRGETDAGIVKIRK